jgi:hypothetical protein
MKKIILMLTLLLGVEVVANGQEWFITATRKGGPSDGYITGGFMKKGWGFFAGLPYGEIKSANNSGITIPPGVNTSTGTISSNMKFGVLRNLKEDKAIVGFGIQPTIEGNKPNFILMYNPLRPSSVLNLWTIGNLVGDNFTLGLGLSYKIK